LEDTVAELKAETTRLTDELRRIEEENTRLKRGHCHETDVREVKRLCVVGDDRLVRGDMSVSSHELVDHVSHSVFSADDDDAPPIDDVSADERFMRDVLHEFAILTSPQWKTSHMMILIATHMTLIQQTIIMTAICSALILLSAHTHCRHLHRSTSQTLTNSSSCSHNRRT